MARDPHPDQATLFPGLEAEAQATVRPWRPTLLDASSGADVEPARLEPILLDLLRRNRELLRGLSMAGVAEDAPEVMRFRETDGILLMNLVFLRRGAVQEIELPDLVRITRETAEELAAIRRQIFQGLDSDPRQQVLKAESRAQIPDRHLELDLAAAELALAEELGEVVELEIPRAGEQLAGEDLPPGFLGLNDVEALAQATMQSWKADQERRPLPRQARLRTLLKGIPVIWLDTVCAALDIDTRPLRYRKDREQAIARMLLDAVRLRQVVRDRLSAEERELLALLVERGGEVPSSTVVRRFGRDDIDGWFWNEEPPTSVLGRLRLHGLAFVGRGAGSGRRAVVVPRELREPLAAALETADLRAAEPADRDLRPELVQAIDAAFPDGAVEMPLAEESYLTDVFPRLKAKLGKIAGAVVLYERDPDGGPGWGMLAYGNDEDDDFSSWDDFIYSYYLLFISPTGAGVEYEVVGEHPDEDDVLRSVAGSGRMGWSVAVSLIAPFATVAAGSMERFEDGSITEPDVTDRLWGEPSEVAALGLPLEAGEALESLREEITGILRAFDVEILSAQELGKRVPWLEADEEIFVGVPGQITVEEAFFFRGL